MRVASAGVLLLVLLLCACGDEEPSVDWSSPTAVFDAAMVALSKSDLQGLWPLLTPNGKAQVTGELQQLQVSLRDEATGAYILDGMRKHDPNLSREPFERARSGTLADVWTFFLLAKPRSPTPKKGPVIVHPGGRTMSIGYEDFEGTVRHVKLSQTTSGWRIEELPL